MTNRTEAPERVYLDGDIEKGDGYWTRCFEDPKPCNEPAIEYTRTDLHQEEIAAEYKRGYWDGNFRGNKDAIAALEKVKREAWNAAIDEVADIIEGEYFEDGLADKIRALKRETE